jgi:hypothetical protein
MALLTTTGLFRAFSQNVDQANRVDMAVAWLGPSNALEFLLNKSASGQLQVRIAVGLSGTATSPIALRSLQGCHAQLRIARCHSGIFHPKFYLFRGPRRNVCWIGSPNFTLQGFANNSELVHEFDDDGSALRWFDDLWNGLPPDSAQAIEHYAANWHRSPASLGSDPRPVDLPPGGLVELLESVRTWGGYLSALAICDADWRRRSENFETRFSVLGDEWSWVDTIAHGRDIAQRADWETLALSEKRILLGIQTQDSAGGWGLLGSMVGAGEARGAFNNNPRIRMKIRRTLQSVIDASGEDDFISAAAYVVREITQLSGFGPAIATRLIALVRPDRGVSVNRGSAPQLSRLTGLPQAVSLLASDQNYPKLLQWTYRRPWYSAGEPQDAFEQTIWSMRAALIDSFVYAV